ncbi:MAG TPA: DUF2065 domain-containing protein [Gammaproteobacteria bacterium]
MEWADLFAGLAFYLILEGLFPFLAPEQWRRSLSALAGLGESRLRLFGLAAVIAGLLLLFSVRG